MKRKILAKAAMSAVVCLMFRSAALCQAPGLPFLNLGVGARAQAMGGAVMAVSQDASAAHSNPALLARLDSAQAFSYYSKFVSDFTYSYFAFAKPWKSHKAAFGFSYGHFSKGEFEGRDENGAQTQSFSAADDVMALSYGRNLNDKLSLGLSGKFVKSGIETSKASGMAFDFSGAYSLSPKTKLAAGVFNLGPSLKYASESVQLPATMALGASHKVSFLTLTSDLKFGLRDQKTSLAFGGQLDIAGAVSVRSGYTSQLVNHKTSGDPNNFGELSGMAMGLGMKVSSRANLDYAFLPMGDLGGTHHISFSYKFGGQ